MDALDLLRAQAETADNLMKQVFANVTAEQVTWKPAGSTTNSIASTYLHVYYVEDRATHRQTGGLTVFDEGGWRQRLNYDPSAQWSDITNPDPAAYRAYAAEVHAASKRYLDALEPAALDEEIETTRGRQPRVNSLSLYLVTHKLTHLGEIAALLGSQGVKGFPF